MEDESANRLFGSDSSKVSDVTNTAPSNDPCFEDVLEKLGSFGKFQIKQLTFGFLGSFITAFMTMSFVFLGFEPSHTCNRVNETELLAINGLHLNNYSTRISYESCDIHISANESGRHQEVTTLSCPSGRNFSSAEHTTFLSEWDLVCESTGKAEISHLIFTSGQLAGGLIVSSIADLIGRKPVLIFTSFFAFATEVIITFAPNIYAIYGFRFFSGLFFQGLSCCFFVHGMELVLPKYRQIYGVIICVIWVFQLLLVGGAAYALQSYSWRYFQAAVAASGIMFFFYPLFLYESPRWLAVRYRFSESLRILRIACKTNKRDFRTVEAAFNVFAAHHMKSKHKTMTTKVDRNPSNFKTKENDHANDSNHSFEVQCAESKLRKDSILTLFSHKKSIVITLTAWFFWMTHNMTYYGLYMTSSTLVGNRFLNYSLMVLVEIPSNLLILFSLSKLTRRTVLRIFLSMTAACLLASTLLLTFGNSDGNPNHTVLSTILFVAGKFAITASFNVLYIMTPEIFPTSVRVSGSGSCTSVDKIGSMVAPFLRPLSTMVSWAPGVLFTSMCVVALCLTHLLPETKDSNLPGTLRDAKLVSQTSSDDSENNAESAEEQEEQFMNLEDKV